MKIIYNISTTASAGGGMERVIVEKANYLADVFGHDVLIITTDQNNQPTFYPYSNNVRHIDIGINYKSIPGNVNFVKNYLTYRMALKKHRQKLEPILLAEKADIVISMSRDEKEFLYKIKDGSKKILESHRCLKPRARIEYKRATGIIKRLKIVYRLFHETWLPKHYDKFILLTEEDKGFWTERPNAAVIPNPLPFNMVECSELKNKRILSVGRISFEKGIDRMLKIWSKVSINYPDWKLTLIGEVVDPELFSLIKDLKLQDSVEILPPTPLIKAEYLKSSIYVMTSLFEGLPMVLLEAIACGLPIVSYDFKCGPRDVINNDIDGYLVTEGDEATFVEKLSLLISNEELRLKMGAQAKLNSQRFSVERVMEKWNNLFIELCNKL